VRAWIGTSGWAYDDWRDRVYPAGLKERDRLAWYANRFPTVEVNASFYRLPAPQTFARWREQTPPGFLFAVKMSRYVTHVRRLRDPQEGVERLWEASGELAEKRGPVLIQLPPTLRADEALLADLVEVLPADMRAAFEFRHPSWDADAIRAQLERARCAWVLADRPGARVPLHVTARWSYVRFHQGRRGSAGYPKAKLRRWADRLTELPVDELFVYFNNDPGGAAIRDATTLRALLGERGLTIPRVAAASSSPSPEDVS
jgi:uncharacterized protein YecE (DUF72 family)